MALLLLVLLAGGGCSKPPIPVHDETIRSQPERYLRYTLRGRFEGYLVKAFRSAYISDPPMFRPGSKAKIHLYSASRIDVLIDGSECRLYPGEVPFPTNPEGVLQVLEKHFAVTREELNLEGFAPAVRKKIESGEIAIGMTREEVFVALGYPSHIDSQVPAANLTRDRILESSTWWYRYSEFPVLPIYTAYWTCRFDTDGKLVQVIR